MTAANDSSFPAKPEAPPVSGANASPPSADATAIQAGPPPPTSEESIPLPPLTRPPERQTTPEQLGRELARLDKGLLVIVLTLAFLLASFAVRNSDFWMHLATGRLLVHGSYSFGVDPFSYTSSAYWVNHSWLYDILLYGLATLAGGAETVAGGAVVVVVKALLVTLLAGVMLQTRRPGQSLWAPATCTGLALVVMSTRLLLQPTLVSLVFLALTVYLLQRPRHEETAERQLDARGKSPLAVYWLLPPLFVLWVNLDQWFLLGPLTVGLYLLGQLLQQFVAAIRTGPDAPDPRQLRTLLMVLLIGLAACLLNPHHYHAFTLPAQLSPTMPVEVFEQDSLFKQWFLSPFQFDEYRALGFGKSIAGQAYYLLFLVGVGSFVLSFYAGWRWWRLVVWLPFAALGAYHARNVPFFAVVSGPILALNFQDYAAGRFGVVPRVELPWKVWSLGGRLVTLLVGLGLLLLAWPGWLHGLPGSDQDQHHRTAWKVSVDPSFRGAAEQLKEWRSQGWLRPEQHSFNFVPDIVNYCAWFCVDDQGLPWEKGFFDYRGSMAFSREVAADYVGVRQIFRGNPARGDAETQSVNWQAIFRKQHINQVVLNNYDPRSPEVAFYLLRDWQQWTLLYLDGRTSIFRWNDRRERSAANVPRLPRWDPNPLAFGANLVPAPEQGPGIVPEQQDLWTRFLHGPPPRPLDAEKAAEYLGYFQQVQQQWTGPYILALDIPAWAGTAGLAAIAPGTVTAPVTLCLPTVPIRTSYRGELGALFFLRGHSGPPGALMLAVRAARRAVAESPGDAYSYVALGESYKHLWTSLEDVWVGRQTQGLQPRQKLRQVQMTTALEYSLKVRPDNEQMHLDLFSVYLRLNYLDLAREHLNAVHRLVNLRGRRSGETEDSFKKRTEELANNLKSLETELSRRSNMYESEQVNQPLSYKVLLALRSGLAKRALDLLVQQADPLQVTNEDIQVLLDLLLTTGQPEQARELLTPELRSRLGPEVYASYAWLMAAAVGSYQDADQYLQEIIQRIEQETTFRSLGLSREQAFGTGGLQGFYATNALVDAVRQLADFRVLRGVLALEQGNIPRAARSFQQALDMSRDQPQFYFDARVIALRYWQLIQQQGQGNKE
jgi:hypothetical protein